MDSSGRWNQGLRLSEEEAEAKKIKSAQFKKVKITGNAGECPLFLFQFRFGLQSIALRILGTNG